MHPSSVIRARTRPGPRISQGDIYRDVEYIESVTEATGIVEIARVLFPLVVVLTQDCDLAQHHDSLEAQDASLQDKQLISVLVAPLYNAEHVHAGNHLTDLGMKMAPVPKSGNTGNFLVTNQRPRYHYIVFPSHINAVPSVVDFKHYFSVNVRYLEEIRPANFVCSVAPLYREEISHRFAAYLARIGLPDFAS